VRCDEHIHVAAVHEGQPAEVDDDEAGAGTRVLEAPGEVWGGGEIELTAESEPRRTPTAVRSPYWKFAGA
jgi:hypothetical protein